MVMIIAPGLLSEVAIPVYVPGNRSSNVALGPRSGLPIAERSNVVVPENEYVSPTVSENTHDANSERRPAVASLRITRFEMSIGTPSFTSVSEPLRAGAD